MPTAPALQSDSATSGSETCARDRCGFHGANFQSIVTLWFTYPTISAPLINARLNSCNIGSSANSKARMSLAKMRKAIGAVP